MIKKICIIGYGSIGKKHYNTIKKHFKHIDIFIISKHLIKKKIFTITLKILKKLILTMS